MMNLAISVLVIVGLWFVFNKAKQPGWAAIIPIYNFYVLLQVVGKPWWWLLLFLIPGVNLVFLIITFNLLSKSFGKGVGYTLGLIFLPFIFIPILGFGPAAYKGPAGK